MYYGCRQTLDRLAEDFRTVITHPTYSLPFLQPGRLIRVKCRDADFGWGVVINFQKRLRSKVSDHISGTGRSFYRHSDEI